MIINQNRIIMAVQSGEIKIIGKFWKMVGFTNGNKFFVKMHSEKKKVDIEAMSLKVRARHYTTQLMKILKYITYDIIEIDLKEDLRLRFMLGLEAINPNKQILSIETFLNPELFQGTRFNKSINIADYITELPKVEIQGTKLSFSFRTLLQNLPKEVEAINFNTYLLAFNRSLDTCVLIYLDNFEGYLICENFSEYKSTSREIDLKDVIPIDFKEDLIVMTLFKLSAARLEEVNNLEALPHWSSIEIIGTHTIFKNKHISVLQTEN